MSILQNEEKTTVKEVSHDEAVSQQNSKSNSHKMGDGVEPTKAENSEQPGEKKSPQIGTGF